MGAAKSLLPVLIFYSDHIRVLDVSNIEVWGSARIGQPDHKYGSNLLITDEYILAIGHNFPGKFSVLGASKVS